MSTPAQNETRPVGRAQSVGETDNATLPTRSDAAVAYAEAGLPPQEAHPGLPPFIKDAVTVLYGIARDSLDLEWQARLIADAMGEMDPVDRIALSKKHPELMSALLKVEHYAACHRTEATYV